MSTVQRTLESCNVRESCGPLYVDRDYVTISADNIHVRVRVRVQTQRGRRRYNKRTVSVVALSFTLSLSRLCFSPSQLPIV